MTRAEAGRIGGQKAKISHAERKKNNREKYALNPTLCQKCNKQIAFEKRNNLFCSHSCAATVNNTKKVKHGKHAKKPCFKCGEMTKFKFCSMKCYRDYTWNETKKDIDQNGFNDLGLFSKIPKRYLLETRGHKCEICGLAEWMGHPMPLVLDHVNGNSEDFSITNLRLLCCNCDAQTPTYKGKNVGNGRHYRRQRYAEGKSY